MFKIVQKIYDWIIATLISNKFKIDNITNEIIKLIFITLIKKKENSTKRWISRCPAKRLADIRTLRVIGRIINLIISIITIKGLNKLGHPWGTKCIILFLKE